MKKYKLLKQNDNNNLTFGDENIIKLEHYNSIFCCNNNEISCGSCNQIYCGNDNHIITKHTNGIYAKDHNAIYCTHDCLIKVELNSVINRTDTNEFWQLENILIKTNGQGILGYTNLIIKSKK